MLINFGKLNSGGTTVDTALPPREIFVALPNKKEGKFEYPRDVQTQVWEHWFKRRDESDLVVKMNTGSGKTVVALLILKSCLNEKKGTAVYVVPDNYLLEQVFSEANDLGIVVTKETNSPLFLSGKAILVINIHKLVNGLSVFGIGDDGIKISIDSLLIDDAHACLNTIEDQFMMTISNQNGAYSQLYNNFSESLNAQCEAKASEIESGEPNTYMQVPFWTWQENVKETGKILLAHKEDNEIKFNWSLLKESLKLCRCVVSANKIEISPHCIPIHIIPSITNATRKIFMTATLADDGILSTHLGITDASISKAVVPDSAGDIGDRMILLPQVINPELSDEYIKDFCKQLSAKLNVVVIVPSEYRARFWKDEANLILDNNNIHKGIERLKSEIVGLTILINRYDGIDLPKSACRFLIIDGLPDVRCLIDKVNQSLFSGSDYLISQIVQRIEQGMGRGIRSSDDYCVVFLMGKTLTNYIYTQGAMDKFSPATKMQLGLSEQLSEQIQGKGFEEIFEVMKYCLNRTKDWVSASKGAIASLTYNESSDLNQIATTSRNIYDYASRKDYQNAVRELNNLINNTTDKQLKGYLMQCLAEYINLYDKAEAQKTLMSAAKFNNRILKPLDGIAYHKLESLDMEQARVCSEYLKSKSSNPNNIIIEINGLLDNIIFKPETADIFEEGFKQLALYLGFKSQRPEAENNKGSDVLWSVGGLRYFVIECKNGAITPTINKHDCNQLNGSVEWFKSEYDNTCQCTPIMIHPSYVFEHAASPNQQTRIIDAEHLEKFKKSVLDFIKSICVHNDIHNVNKIRESLITHKLRPSEILQHFTADYKCK